MKEAKDKDDIVKKIEVNIYEGGQFNVAFDNGLIEAQQNNEMVLQAIIDASNQEKPKYFKNDIIENEKAITEEDMESFPIEQLNFFKKQLGNKLKGDESKLEILCRFLYEMDKILQSDRRYDVMPIFTEVPRKSVEGYLYLNDCKMAFDKVEITVYYWDAFEKYVIEGTYYYLLILLCDKEIAGIKIGYTLCFPDVTERLYGFRKASKVVNSERIKLLLQDENRTVEVDTTFIGEERIQQIEMTDYWIEQMEKIAAIENYYKIKFRLPKKATEEDYFSINILYESIKKIAYAVLPALPLVKEMFKNSIVIDNEYLISDGATYEHLNIFGYHFEPKAVYVMQTTLIWKRKMKAWETKEGGVPVRVEFICYKI